MSFVREVGSLERLQQSQRDMQDARRRLLNLSGQQQGLSYLTSQQQAFDTRNSVPTLDVQVVESRIIMDQASLIMDQASLDKAEELLINNLSREQKEKYIKFGWFYVRGNVSKDLFCIREQETNFNIWKIRDERVVERFCIEPINMVPHKDKMLIQKLIIESNEIHFLKIANTTNSYVEGLFSRLHERLENT